MLLIIYSAVLFFVASCACAGSSGYEYYPDVGGWLKLYKQVAKWEQAIGQCLKDGAVLASPLTDNLRDIIENIIEENGSIPFYIGANAIYTSGQFVSIEGTPIRNMPVQDMFDLLDESHGQCLRMNNTSINVVSCKSSLPYLCYKTTSECGTFDPQYRYEPSTGSCYKIHEELRQMSEASSVCLSEDGYLHIINNDGEARLVTTMIPDVEMTWAGDVWFGWKGVFLGAVDWSANGTFQTIYGGKPIHQYYNKWDVGQPDSLKLARCVVLNQRGKLDNTWCTNGAPVICEKDPLKIINGQELPDNIEASML